MSLVVLPPTSPTGSTFLDHATTGVAASMATSPIWLPWLETTSQVAASLAPILGLVWLIVQIWAKVIETRRRNKDD